MKPVGEKAEKGLIRQVNESAILRAAEQVFARAGFEGTTMADIADEAGLPKANVHYYFGNKRELYGAVLDAVLHDWLAPMDTITEHADPTAALTSYITLKMTLVQDRPHASRVFANELLHGAPVLGDALRGELRDLVREKSAVVDRWIAQGRMAPLDSVHLFFTIWAATQTYADFDVQVRAVLGRRRQDAVDHARATAHVVLLILRACGLGTGVPVRRPA